MPSSDILAICGWSPRMSIGHSCPQRWYRQDTDRVVYFAADTSVSSSAKTCYTAIARRVVHDRMFSFQNRTNHSESRTSNESGEVEYAMPV